MSDSIEDRAKRDRDMILAPNEYAFISDETKGEVNAFVGPNKTNLTKQLDSVLPTSNGNGKTVSKQLNG